MNLQDYLKKGAAWVGGNGVIAIVLVLAVFAATILSTISLLNDEATSRNLVGAQQTVVKAYQDKTWKIIQQKAQVSNKYAEDFKEVYPKMMDSRYGGAGGSQDPMFKFVMEANPQLSTELYKELSVAVESLREDLTSQEIRLVDLDRQHDVQFDKFPSGMILSVFGRTKTDIVIITSDKTNNTFDNGGVDNDVSVFGD